MRIDTHGHLKSSKLPQHGKKCAMQTIVEEAMDSGIGRIFDMPNIINPVTGNPVITRVDAEARIKFARQVGVSTQYRTYIGASLNYLEEAVDVVQENSLVVGMKAFMGPTTGNFGIKEVADQESLYKRLHDKNYDGVLAVHCEDESEFIDIWNPQRPETHSLARPLKSELSSIRKQIDFARKADFKGTLLGCHVTSGKSIELFKEAYDNGIKVAVEITPHHSILRMEDMRKLGMFGKMNPPLRSKKEQEGLLEYAKHETKIPVVIGSDHARHPFMEKVRGSNQPGKKEKSYPSGMGLDVYQTLYPRLLYEISSDPSVPNNRVEDVTYNNVVNIFGRKKCGV